MISAGGLEPRPPSPTTMAIVLEWGKASFDRHQVQVRDRASTTDLSQPTRHLRG